MNIVVGAHLGSSLIALAVLGMTGIAGAQQVDALPASATQPAAVRAVLQLPRESTADRFRTLMTLVDLQAFGPAGNVLAELNGANPTADELAELVTEFGSHRMLQLARTNQLAGGAELSEKAMAAAAALARDPERLAQLIATLNDPAPEKRHAARVDLQAAGVDAVRALVGQLALKVSPEQRLAISRALVDLAPTSEGPLLAVLTSENHVLSTEAARVLGHLQTPQALPLLAVPALMRGNAVAGRALFRLSGRNVSPIDAKQLLHREISNLRRGVPPFTPAGDGRINLWFWDNAEGSLSEEHYSTVEAGVIWAARLAQDLYVLDPTDALSRRLATVLGLEAAKLRQGYEIGVNDLALSAVVAQAVEHDRYLPGALSEVLAAALDGQYYGAAAAICELMGELSQANSDGRALVAANGGQPAPLAQALGSPDRRVRYHAAQAILAIDPQHPFAGASRVPTVLAELATGGRQRTALVGTTSIAKSSTLGGLLHEHGYTGEIASTGLELIRAARDATDVEAVLVDMDIRAPTIREVLYQLRSLPHVENVPVALLAPPGWLPAAEALATEHELVLAVSRVHSPAAAGAVVDKLKRLAGRSYVPLGERAEQAQFASAALGELAGRSSYYRLRQPTQVLAQSLHANENASQTLAHLALIGTAEAQRTLLDFASRPTAPLDGRKAAADQFAESVRLHGVLLTSGQIVRQYDRYNASEFADATTQQILGELLDVIEGDRGQ